MPNPPAKTKISSVSKEKERADRIRTESFNKKMKEANKGKMIKIHKDSFFGKGMQFDANKEAREKTLRDK